MRKKTLLSWSSGKDSAWALYMLRQDPAVEVIGLFSVVNEHYNRVSMHSTRAELLRRQAESAGLPLYTINLPDTCANDQYDTIMGGFVAESAANGTECIAFGDLFLEEVRQYREKRLKGTGIDPLFPLWRIPTVELADRMLAAGLQAYISSVDLTRLPASFAGRQWSTDLLRELPPGVDPCGEYGEMHTIVVGGPMFTDRIEVEVGEVVLRNGFAYADILPISHGNGKPSHRADPAILTGRCQDYHYWAHGGSARTRIQESTDFPKRLIRDSILTVLTEGVSHGRD